MTPSDETAVVSVESPGARVVRRLALALVIGMIAGGITFLIRPATYECVGMVHVRPMTSTLIFHGDGIMPMYDQFVATQAVMLKAERCMDMAMGSPRWLDGGNPSRISSAAQVNFKKNLQVRSAGEIIRVSFTSNDKKAASDAVAAIIDAYQQLAIDGDPEQVFRKLTKLEELKRYYESTLANSRARIAEMSNPFTPDTLQNRYSYKQMEVNQGETEARASKDAYDGWRVMHPADAIRLEAEFARALERPEGPVTATATTTANLTAVAADSLQPGKQLYAKMMVDQLRFQRAAEEVIRLGKTISAIHDEEASQQQGIAWLSQTKQALEELRVMQNATGRISVLSQGDRPELMPLAAIPVSATVGGGAFLATALAALYFPRRMKS